MFPTTLLTTLLLALSVAANPIVQVRDSRITLPLSRRVNTTSVHNLLQHDLNRVKAFKARAKAIQGGELTFDEEAIVNEPVDNQAVTYIATVGVGSPATSYQLIVDTGSSNTWVGSGRSYVRTSTSVQTSNRVAVTYGSGSFSGNEFTDTVTLGSLVIPRQSIGVATRSTGFEGTDGILGIGPVDLTLGTLSPATNSLIPTVTDNLFANGQINANEIGISFEPTNTVEIVNGELTWGGTDSSRFTGSINFTPRTSTSPSSLFWGINQSVRYGASTTILSSTAGIVDTDNNTGLLRLTTAQFANLQSLFFTTNGVTYELTANAQIWPRALNTAIGGNTNSVYLIVGDIGTPSGEGFDFVNGYAFLERFYSVFNSANGSVGFATTSFTRATTN
ncbi:hypothetical protein NP233_g2369 [Leucocoprinus birnbaumii]|uniref:Peptidase A1 domain-containing protein n=1 Tax=Leucocoprinus birnbaumii TaxID=56174 RepID=A0AAD5YYW1_9AGAR|nr:hypothetical protein NP233_g2369 [Leucocoprinus birnbaumii]